MSGKPYTCVSDIWSLGVIFYILLCGYPPFASDKEDPQELFKIIRMGRYTMSGPEWSSVSEDAKDIIRYLLVVDPNKRCVRGCGVGWRCERMPSGGLP